jgi:NAD(P)-dependent dehydrogenase (short-subunit alcohol dehydrogenase family)
MMTGIHKAGVGYTILQTVDVGLAALTENFALELAPIRVNTIAAGFVDTPLSALLLGEGLQARREELVRTLPARRVVQPEDIAFLAVHIMENRALTGATINLDGGQRLIP